MSPPPTSIDGTDITGATIDGQEVQEITIDGQSVFLAEQIVDNFEPELYEDQGATLSTYYDGPVGTFNRQTSNVGEGTTALKANTSDDLIFSTSGLPNFPSRGDTFRYLFRSDGFNPLVSFCVQDPFGSFDRYEVGARAGGEVFFFKFLNGNFSVLFRTDFNGTSGVFHEAVIDIGSGGAIQVTITNPSGTVLHNFTVNDSDLDTGGIGFRSSGGSPSFFDGLKLI